MKKRTLLCLLLTAALGGCLIGPPGHLYPVQGPLAAQQPVPVYTLNLSIVAGGSSVSTTLKDGEVCRGTIEMVSPNEPGGRSMQDDWDSVYGNGFFVSTVLGNKRARTTLTGSHGTQLNVELYNPEIYNTAYYGDAHSVIGVARDNQGNVYKITF